MRRCVRDWNAAKAVILVTGTTRTDRSSKPVRNSSMLWGKQLYNYDVARWLDGDPGMPTPPASRLYGRNSRWRQFNAFDIMHGSSARSVSPFHLTNIAPVGSWGDARSCSASVTNDMNARS